MKRVLHVISQKPSDTGSGVYLQNLILNGKSSENIQAIVFATNANNNIEIDIPKRRQYEIKFETDEIPFSIVGMSDVMPYKSTVFSELTNSMTKILIETYREVVKNAILDFKPDIILCQHLWILTSITKQVIDELTLPVPVYGFCHGTDLRQIYLSESHKEFVLSGCKNLSGVFALNDFQFEKISEIYGYEKNQIQVLGNGYNSDYFYHENNKKTNKDVKRIIYAGKLSYSKGLLSLLKAFEKINDGTFELYIAGSGHGDECVDILQRIDHSENIYYLGKLSQFELGNEFRKSDIFVLPSFYEGLPLVVIEAIACGLKVVCSDICGVSEWINKCIGSLDVIIFVGLPDMIEVDKPNPIQLDGFESRLANAIIEMSGVNIEDFNYELLSKFTWKEVFNKLNNII